MPPRAPNAGKVLGRRSSPGGLGRTQSMQDMPLDVLVEIFSWTHPRDLLNLARTTTAFRNFLMSRDTAGSLWKKARETVEDLPDCPAYLSEPAYANLMFFPHCHNCLKPNVQTVIFEFSVRYCPACKKKLVVDEEAMGQGMFILVVGMDTGCKDDILNRIRVGKGAKEEEYYHKPEVERAFADWDAIPEGDRAAGRAFVKRNAAAVKLVEQTCPKLYVWKNAQTQARADAIESTRSQRFSDILDRLRGEGWSDEIDAMDQKTRDALYLQASYARKAVELTDRAWANIRDAAHASMENVRRDRLARERRPVLIDRFKALAQALADGRPPGWRHTADADMEPLLVDFALTPEVREIAEAPDSASNSDIPRWPVDDVRAMFERMARKWRHERKANLISMLKGAMPELEGVEKPLKLAVAAFSCCSPGCERKAPLRWPEVLAHPCTRLSAWPTDGDKDVYASALRDLDPFQVKRPHSLEYIKVNPQMVHNLCAVMQVYDLDPLKTTQKSLDKVKDRLQCVECVTEREDGSKFEVFDWLRALLHYDDSSHEARGISCRLELLDKNDSKDVCLEELRLRGRRDLNLPYHYRLGCTHCRWHDCDSELSMMNHLKYIHEITVDANELMHYHSYTHLDTDSRRVPPIYIYAYSDGRRFVQHNIV